MRNALQPLPGVAKVDIDFGARLAKVSVDPDKFDQQAALNALSDAGFPAQVQSGET